MRLFLRAILELSFLGPLELFGCQLCLLILLLHLARFLASLRATCKLIPIVVGFLQKHFVFLIPFFLEERREEQLVIVTRAAAQLLIFELESLAESLVFDFLLFDRIINSKRKYPFLKNYNTEVFETCDL